MAVKNILVPFDGSKNSFRAFKKAIFLAKQNQSSITGLFVIKVPASERVRVREMLMKTLQKQYANFTKKAKELCKKNGVPFLDVIEYGKEGPRIVSYAAKNKFDLIVMGSRGMGSVREYFLGSTSYYVLHESKLPVMIVK